MAQRITPSQLKNKLRQMQNKQKRVLDQLNREVRQRNQKVKRAVNQYNSGVKQHNTRVRSNRQKIVTELRRLQSNQRTVYYSTVRTSAVSLNERYEYLDSRESNLTNVAHGSNFLDLSEKENANSLEVSNALENIDNDIRSNHDLATLQRSDITEMLNSISPDLNNRWTGALFSLNPENPDAARHFCTSAREVFVQILDLNAPDEEVLKFDPECEKTNHGNPTRKEKVRYLLSKSGIKDYAAVDFVDENVKNVLTLFRVFNDGTHGSSGKFSLSGLMAIKTRVESGISYLSSISAYV